MIPGPAASDPRRPANTSDGHTVRHLPTRRVYGRTRAWSGLWVAMLLISSTVMPSQADASLADAGGPGSGQFAAGHHTGVHAPSIRALEDQFPDIFWQTGCRPSNRDVCPDEPLLRYEMASWLVRILDGRHAAFYPGLRTRFSDVSNDQWYMPTVERLAELEVTVGCSADPPQFCPDDSITRAQMATMLVRAFELEPAPSAGFADTEENTHEANVDAIAGAGITVGCKLDPLRFCPDRSVTKGQMATFLARALELI